MKYIVCFLSVIMLFNLMSLQRLHADTPLPKPKGKIILLYLIPF